MRTERNRFADRLFAEIAPDYERMGRILSLGQDSRWRRFLVSRTTALPGGRVLDVAAGTQLVSRELVNRKQVDVVALDQSEGMLRAGRDRSRAERVMPVVGRAERLPFPDAGFDSVTLTYLLRYVDDPAATVGELVRVLKPAGSIAMLEFLVPDARLARIGWWGYTRGLMPLVGAFESPAWARTATFLGPSISRFVAEHGPDGWVEWFRRAGVVDIRLQRFLFGSAIVLWGVKGR